MFLQLGDFYVEPGPGLIFFPLSKLPLWPILLHPGPTLCVGPMFCPGTMFHPGPTLNPGPPLHLGPILVQDLHYIQDLHPDVTYIF